MSMIVYQSTLPTGEEIIIRYPQEADTKEYLNFINELSAEQTYILFQGKVITMEEEEQYITSVVKQIEEKKYLMLSLWVDGVLAGNSDVRMQSDALKHEGIFGIALRKAFRGKGLGKLLMGKVLEHAENELPDLHVITLGVFGENMIGREMYKKFGFKEYGWLPESIIRKGTFDDHIFMYKKIR